MRHKEIGEFFGFSCFLVPMRRMGTVCAMRRIINGIPCGAWDPGERGVHIVLL